MEMAVWISGRGVDFLEKAVRMGKWFVFKQLVRMGKCGREEGGCGKSWQRYDSKLVRFIFRGRGKGEEA